MATIKVYVPRETAAISVGANEVAVEIERQAEQAGESIQLIRNGSWGASWLEPMVEVEVGDSRIAYGNVTTEDVAGLFEAGFLKGGDHPRLLGQTHEIPYLANQDRWSFLRCGLVDPLSVEDYQEHKGFSALEKALADGTESVLDAVLKSGLRGRGGAAFPTGIKWRTVADTRADQKYIACNGDEGDSGTFSDRILMESDPMALFEGMAIAGYAVGATKGLHLPALRVPPHVRGSARSVGQCSFGRLAGGEHSGQRFRLRHRCTSRRWSLYLRRGNRDARKPRGKEGHDSL